MKNSMMLFGVAALSVIAAAGWMRQPSVQTQDPTAAAPIEQVATYAPAPTQAAVYQTAQAVPAQRAITTQSAMPVYQAVQYRQPVPYSNNSRYRDDSYRDSNYRTDTYRDDRRVYNGRRSTEKSAVIIGGTAAAGAVLGGIAGGGKGAAIGALSGGAIGAIYDRLTHKKTDGYGWRNNRY